MTSKEEMAAVIRVGSYFMENVAKPAPIHALQPTPGKDTSGMLQYKLVNNHKISSR